MKSKMIVKGEINVAGVYEMATKDGVILYDGSSIEIGDALSRHLYSLKRGYYMDTNKRPLQEAYDREDLVFYVIHKSAYNDEVRNMTIQQKEDLQKALGAIEQFNIALNKDTVCNKIKNVTKFSTSPSVETTIKRHNANIGSMNPNSRFSEDLISEILWLKLNGYKPKEISRLIEENYKVDIRSKYISQLGVHKWIYLEAKKPAFVA